MLTADQIKGQILYEDAVCFAYLPNDSAVLGHIHIVPKQPVETLEECSEELAVQLFYVASYAATAVYEGLGAQGTNIICNNGKGAGAGQLVLEVVPRSENDGIPLKWDPTQQSQENLDSTASTIRDKADVIAAGGSLPSVASPAAPVLEGSEPQEMQAGEEENYMIKHLYRIP
jgi:histidine triad (HIT) family protein